MLDHEKYMRRCIELSRQGEGRTSPNPLVGAVVVNDNGDIIGEGFHAAYGGAHAEVVALDKAGVAAAKQTLYVNLEPCCHHGKTPPCTDRVIASGVKRVVFGMLDPNPKVAGGGQKLLEDAGIETISNILVKECRYVNRGFLKWQEKWLPWLCLKIAATVDGRIADRHKHSRWISGKEARRHTQELRNAYDCVMVGSGTVIIDDPELIVHDLPDARNPMRAIIDTRLLTGPNRQVCQHDDFLTWIFASQEAIDKHSSSFPKSVSLMATPVQEGHVDLNAVLNLLGADGIRKVLCEGGAGLGAALLEQKLVDEIQWFIAPKLLVDGQAKSALTGSKNVNLPDAVNFISHTYKEVGPDLLIHALIHEP